MHLKQVQRFKRKKYFGVRCTLMSIERSCCKVLLGLPLFGWPANSTRWLRDLIDCTSGLNFLCFWLLGYNHNVVDMTWNPVELCFQHELKQTWNLRCLFSWEGIGQQCWKRHQLCFLFSGSGLKYLAKFRTTQGDQPLAVRHEIDKQTISRQNLAQSQHHHQHHFIWILSLAALGGTILNNSIVLYDCLL